MSEAAVPWARKADLVLFLHRRAPVVHFLGWVGVLAMIVIRWRNEAGSSWHGLTTSQSWTWGHSKSRSFTRMFGYEFGLSSSLSWKVEWVS